VRIDAHVHVVPPELPGAGVLDPVLRAPSAERAAELRRQMHDAGVTHALAMGRLDAEEDDALGVVETLSIADVVPGLHAVGAADPRRTDADHLKRVERQLADGRIVALKGYLGYLHFGPDHAGYRPYYELAERFKRPFIFHTGDTYSATAKLRFAHPLLVDEVAVDFPDVRFVMAHLGNPWMIDAAEVVYKNLNVWADLSGLVVGGGTTFSDEQRVDTLSDLRSQVRRAFRYAERPNRFLFGSDWPLVPIAGYAGFVASAIPANCHDAVFHDNAALLFRLGS
jgi:predicted TIM-barrel fold metal-dependent hydrolase